VVVRFYSLFLDRFVNGNPSNDDANGTYFEQDANGNQLRNGGDLAGLVDTLDYIQGMGIKASLYAPVETLYKEITSLRAFTLPVHHSSTFHGSRMATR
jgi:hypothetical protein